MADQYAAQLGHLSIDDYLDKFLRLVGPQFARVVAEYYTGAQEPGNDIPDLKALTPLLASDSVTFFQLVSAFVADPPPLLDRRVLRLIADEMVIVVDDEHEFLTIDDRGVWYRQIMMQKRDYEPAYALSVPWLNHVAEDIVPLDIYDYLKSAVVCFRNRLFTGALTLAAIAFEATLKEGVRLAELDDKILEGYTYQPVQAVIEAFAEPEDATISLELNIEGANRDLRSHFRGQRADPESNWIGDLKLRIVRADRLISDNKERVTLTLQTNQNEEAEYFSSGPRNPKHRKAGRFIEFNSIAEQYGWFARGRLVHITAEVLRRMRNRLVHWEREALDKQIEGTDLTLRTILQDSREVENILHDVSGLIGDVYFRVNSHGK